MNDWYVINDYGDIAESNLSEINAKLLAEKLNKKVWYISDVNSQYMISYDNKATNDFDQVEKYETEKDALNALGINLELFNLLQKRTWNVCGRYGH